MTSNSGSTSRNDDDVRDAVVADIVDEMEKITIKTPVQEAEENEMEVNEGDSVASFACAVVRYVPSNSGIGFFM